jgi:hypothetical protein
VILRNIRGLIHHTVSHSVGSPGRQPATLTAELRQWMEEREIAWLADMRGMISWQRSPPHGAVT